jgi:hypothetical protein
LEFHRLADAAMALTRSANTAPDEENAPREFKTHVLKHSGLEPFTS